MSCIGVLCCVAVGVAGGLVPNGVWDSGDGTTKVIDIINCRRRVGYRLLRSGLDVESEIVRMRFSLVVMSDIRVASGRQSDSRVCADKKLERQDRKCQLRKRLPVLSFVLVCEGSLSVSALLD